MTKIAGNLFSDLLRYGTIKSDFEVNDKSCRRFRVRVIEHENKKWFTVMVDGELLECKEV